MGGAPLAAGGWHADGKSLGELMRLIAQSSILMPSATASQLWAGNCAITANDPCLRNSSPGAGWGYARGWYVRGNWVAWAGGTHGEGAMVLHNLVYDFTVVVLSNVKDNGFGQGAVDTGSLNINKLLVPSCSNCWGTSVLGTVFPCVSDPNTQRADCPSWAAY